MLFREYEGDDPLGFVVSLNLKRRHLDTSQRAIIAARISNLSNGQKKSAVENSIAQPQAASMLNVSRDVVIQARKVIDKAEPEIISAVDAGLIPVSQAAKLAEASPEFQRKVVERTGRSFAIHRFAVNRRR